MKGKYHDRIHEIKKKGISCKVIFIETERCTELWFLYHFTKTAITRKFSCYDELEKELRKYRPQYGKHEKYFKSISGIHNELTVKGTPKGSLKQAVKNAKSSVNSRDESSQKLYLLRIISFY